MRRAAAMGIALALGTLTACTGAAEGDGGSRSITVFAASSLTTPFERLGEEFEAAHEGVDVIFSFGGSGDLRDQIEAGAPADVFASADTLSMDPLVAQALVGEPEIFAENALALAVPPDNPAAITDLADLTEPGIKLVVCAPSVPCGSLTEHWATTEGIDLRPVSEEQAVTDVLGKLLSGEADAGFVYVSDVLTAGADRLTPVAISAVARTRYPIATVAESDEPDLARAFADFVLGEAGSQALRDAHFDLPSPSPTGQPSPTGRPGR